MIRFLAVFAVVVGVCFVLHWVLHLPVEVFLAVFALLFLCAAFNPNRRGS